MLAVPARRSRRVSSRGRPPPAAARGRLCDLVVCAIALVHLADIEGPFRDSHGCCAPAVPRGPDQRGRSATQPPGPDRRPRGRLGYLPVYPRLASDYLTVALPLGSGAQVRGAALPSPLLDEEGRTIHDGERLPLQDTMTRRLSGAARRGDRRDQRGVAGQLSSIIWTFNSRGRFRRCRRRGYFDERVAARYDESSAEMLTGGRRSGHRLPRELAGNGTRRARDRDGPDRDTLAQREC